MLLSSISPIVPYLTLILATIVSLCFVYWGRSRGAMNGKNDLAVRNVLIQYYLLTALSCICLMLYLISNVAYAAASYLAIFILPLQQVSFAHFVFMLTRTSSSGRFSRFNYILPLFVGTAFLLWSLAVPTEVQQELLITRSRKVNHDYYWFSHFFLFKYPIRLAFTIGYSAWAMVRIYRFRRVIRGYSADEVRGPLRWLSRLVIISLLLVLAPAFSPLLGYNSIFMAFKYIVPLIMLGEAVISVSLCVNYWYHNYVLMVPTRLQLYSKHPVRRSGQKSLGDDVLTKDIFDSYLSNHKPHLNARLRITDVATDLGTNRSYVSIFIRDTYGVNFSCLINKHRLEEYSRLLNDPFGSTLSRTGRVRRSGFSNYHNMLMVNRMLRNSR